jgi:hypothetical protein
MASKANTNENETPIAEDEKTDQESCQAGGGSIFDDIEKLRKRQDFDALISTQHHLTSVPVGKPGKQVWFQVRPGDEWQIQAALLDWKEDRTQFYITPALYPNLETEATLVILRTVVTTQGSVSLWPLKMPGADGRDNEWWQSARRAAALAESNWVRMITNNAARSYDVITPEADYGEPARPSQSFSELLKIAFAGKIIETLDHPVVAELRGRNQ